jgi:hypothetical protein
MEMDLENIALAREVGKTASDARIWLAGQCEEWLLLFDSADDTGINLQTVFPSCSHGNILVTSRNPETRAHAPYSNYKVSNMTPEDATDLLLTMIQREVLPETHNMAMSIVKVW